MTKRKLGSLGGEFFTDIRPRQNRKRISTTDHERTGSDDCEIISVSLRTEQLRRHLNVSADSNNDPNIDCASGHLPVVAASRQNATKDQRNYQDKSEYRTAKAHESPQSENVKLNSPKQTDYENENRASAQAEPNVKFRSEAEEAEESRPDNSTLSACPEQQNREKSNCTLSTNLQIESLHSGAKQNAEGSSIECMRSVGPVHPPEVPVMPYHDIQHSSHGLFGLDNYPWGDPRFISLVNMNLHFMNAFSAPSPSSPRVDNHTMTPTPHINTMTKQSSSLNTNVQCQHSTQKSRDYVSEFHRLRQLGTVQDITFKFSGANTDWTCEVQCTGIMKAPPGTATFSASAKGTSQKKAKHLASKIILEKISNYNSS